MADNRMYIKCRACGKMVYLGKRLFSPCYHWENYYGEGVHLEDKINDFFKKHTFCDGWKEMQPDGVDGWPDHFEIAYESEPCWKGEEDEQRRSD